MAGPSTDKSSLDNQFALFCKFGDSKSNGKTITLTNADKWMKQAKIFDKKITTTDTGISFNKFKTKQMDLTTFKQYLEDLAKSKKMEVGELIAKLETCGLPGTSNTTKLDGADAVNRLTDTSKYTGSHKERFDAEGKGKGAEGRADVSKNEGYVTGYKEQGTYAKKK